MIPYHDHSRFFSDNIFFLEGDCSPLSFQVLILCWTVTAISFVVFFAGCQPIIWPFWKGVTSLPQVWHGCLRNNKLHTGSVRVKKKTCHQLKHIKLLPICLVKSRWLPFFGHAVCHVANWAYIILHILWLTTVIIAWHFFWWIQKYACISVTYWERLTPYQPPASTPTTVAQSGGLNINTFWRHQSINAPNLTLHFFCDWPQIC